MGKLLERWRCLNCGHLTYRHKYLHVVNLTVGTTCENGCVCPCYKPVDAPLQSPFWRY